MAIVKTLDILLRGKTGQLSKDMSKGVGIIRSSMAKIGGLLAAAVPVLSLAGLAAGIQSARVELDGLAKRSVRLQIDSSELVSLERVAGLAGLSIGDITNAQKFLTVNTQKAEEGLKEQKAAFDKLGISISAFKKLKPTEQLVDIAKSLSQVTDRAEKARIATVLFGKQGLNLLPLLADSGEQLAAAFASTKSLGGIFSTTDLSKVETLNDTVDDLQFTISNLVKQLTIDLAPALTDLAQALIDAIKPGAALREIFVSLSEPIKAVANDISSTIDLFRQFNELLTAGGTLADKFIGSGAKFILSGGLNPVSLSLRLKSAVLGMFGLGKEAETVANEVKNASSELDKFTTSAAAIQSKNINLGSAQFGSSAAFETVYGVRIQAPMQQLIAATQEGNAILGDIRDGQSGFESPVRPDILGDLG